VPGLPYAPKLRCEQTESRAAETSFSHHNLRVDAEGEKYRAGATSGELALGDQVGCGWLWKSEA